MDEIALQAGIALRNSHELKPIRFKGENILQQDLPGKFSQGVFGYDVKLIEIQNDKYRKCRLRVEVNGLIRHLDVMSYAAGRDRQISKASIQRALDNISTPET